MLVRSAFPYMSLECSQGDCEVTLVLRLTRTTLNRKRSDHLFN